MDSSQGGAIDASSVPAGRAETVETTDLSQGGAVNASSVPAGRAETVETMDSSQEGAVDASFVGRKGRKRLRRISSLLP